MVNTLIQANDCLFQVKIGDDYVSVICAKSFTVTINTEEKEITTVTDGAYKAYDYKSLSYTANLNFAMRIPDSITTTAFDFIQLQMSFEEVPFRAVWVDPAGGIRTFKGTGIIKTNNLVTSSAQLADATVDILGSGTFEIGTALNEFVNLTLICTGNDTAPVFIKFWLLNEDGDTIFQTDTLAEASGGMLDNPLNLTIPVPYGNWYFYYYVDTNTVGNEISVSAAPAYGNAFNDNVTEFNTYPNDTYDFTEDVTVTITLGVDTPPPDCVPVAIPFFTSLPDTTVGALYLQIVAIIGSAPYNITNVTKPSWLNITVNEAIGVGQLILSGTPDAAGTDVLIEMDINNACGTVQLSDTIDVASAPVDQSEIVYDFDQFDQYATGTLRIYVNSILIVDETNFASGSIFVNPGDTVQAQVLGHAGDVTKSLTVDTLPSGPQLFTGTSASNQSFAWVAASSTDYSITAYTEPII